MNLGETNCVQRSKHLRFSDSRNGYRGVYHSLFGNLLLVSDRVASRLEDLERPTQATTARNILGNSDYEELFSCFHLIRTDGEERSLVQDWLAQRRCDAGEGRLVGGLQITASNACNFACSYCFADRSDDRSGARQRIARSSAHVTFDVAHRAIDEVIQIARRNGKRQVGVKFLGREPLVNWSTIHRLMESYGDEVAWSLTTNGSLVTADVATALAQHRVNVMVSLDGPKETNDRFRLVKSSERSAYDLTLRGLRVLSETSCAYGVSSVASRSTDWDSFGGFVEMLAGLGARELELALVMQTGERMRSHSALDVDSLTDQLIAVYRHAVSLGLPIHGDWIDPFHRLRVTRFQRGESEVHRPLGASCSASDHQLSLEPTGDLFPCRAMSLHYGHLDNLAEILSSPSYAKVVMRTFLNVPYCRGCRLEGVCQGTCLGSSEEASGDIYQPQEGYCRVYREVAARLFDDLVAVTAAGLPTGDPRRPVSTAVVTESSRSRDAATETAVVVGTPSVGTPAVGTPAVGTPAVGTPAVGTPAVGSAVACGAVLGSGDDVDFAATLSGTH